MANDFSLTSRRSNIKIFEKQRNLHNEKLININKFIKRSNLISVSNLIIEFYIYASACSVSHVHEVNLISRWNVKMDQNGARVCVERGEKKGERGCSLAETREETIVFRVESSTWKFV